MAPEPCCPAPTRCGLRLVQVSFIQMMRALMPPSVYACSLLWGVERRDAQTVAILALITAGIAVASYGEAVFVLVGVVYQLASICTESNRVVLVQILLQGQGVHLNPVTSMYYVSPACTVALLLPWLVLEGRPLLLAGGLPAGWATLRGGGVLLCSALSAFALNCSVFLLIGRTSAVAMNVTGVLKDWVIIFLSWLLFHGKITRVSMLGYGIALIGVALYNYKKWLQLQPPLQHPKGHELEMGEPAPNAGGGGAWDAAKGGGMGGADALDDAAHSTIPPTDPRDHRKE